MWIAVCSVIGLLVAFALAAWYAKTESAKTQAALDKVSSLQADTAIKEKSSELVKEASAVRTNSGRYDDERLSTTPLPSGDYRD